MHHSPLYTLRFFHRPSVTLSKHSIVLTVQIFTNYLCLPFLRKSKINHHLFSFSYGLRNRTACAEGKQTLFCDFIEDNCTRLSPCIPQMKSPLRAACHNLAARLRLRMFFAELSSKESSKNHILFILLCAKFIYQSC